MSKLILVGFTNGHQISYASEPEGEGCFYSNTDNECYIPLYMLETHHHRIESTSYGEVTTSGNHDCLVEENKRLRDMLTRLTSHDNCRKDVIHLMSEADSLLSELDKQS